MKSFVVDTNIFLRFILKDIPAQYEEARKIFNDAKNGKIELLVPQIVIFEIEFALNKFYKFPKNEAVETFKSLLGMSYFKIQDREIFKKANILFPKHNISFADSFLLFFAQQNQADLFTFDKHLKKIKAK